MDKRSTNQQGLIETDQTDQSQSAYGDIYDGNGRLVDHIARATTDRRTQPTTRPPPPNVAVHTRKSSRIDDEELSRAFNSQANISSPARPQTDRYVPSRPSPPVPTARASNVTSAIDKTKAQGTAPLDIPKRPGANSSLPAQPKGKYHPLNYLKPSEKKAESDGGSEASSGERALFDIDITPPKVGERCRTCGHVKGEACRFCKTVVL